MSKAFGDFKWSRLQDRPDMLLGLEGLQQNGNKDNPFSFNVVTEDGEPKRTKQHVTDEFIGYLNTIRKYFYLDRSEAARRTFIDAFIIKALQLSKASTAIVVQEHEIKQSNRTIGHGKMDYLICEVVEEPKLAPSIVIEAKKGNTPMDAGQLISAMISTLEVADSKRLKIPTYCGGIMSSGETWFFVALATVASEDSTVSIWISKDYSVTDGNGEIYVEGCRRILSILAQWFATFTSNVPIFF